MKDFWFILISIFKIVKLRSETFIQEFKGCPFTTPNVCLACTCPLNPRLFVSCPESCYYGDMARNQKIPGSALPLLYLRVLLYMSTNLLLLQAHSPFKHVWHQTIAPFHEAVHQVSLVWAVVYGDESTDAPLTEIPPSLGEAMDNSFYTSLQGCYHNQLLYQTAHPYTRFPGWTNQQLPLPLDPNLNGWIVSFLQLYKWKVHYI